MFDLDIHRPRQAVACYPVHGLARLETGAPGPELGALLAAVDPADLDMYDVVSYLGACERQTAWAQARQLAAVRELSGRRLVPGPHGEPADTPHPDATINDFAADEVAAALSLARRSGQERVWLANALTRLPRTEAALAAGALTLSKVKAIVETLSVLATDAALAAEHRVLGRATEQTLGNLRRSLARAVAAADPTAATRRAAKARAERRVMLTPAPDGMCEFWALLPAPDAMALWTAITALADQALTADRAAQPDETDATGETSQPVARTLDQARADVLADLAHAALDHPDLPRNHRRRPHIQVTVAATTLLGLDDQPGELAGYGPITAELARQLAADATWHRLLTDPATGALLDYGHTLYQPPQNLADHVIARDQTCRGPGCRIPAERCDLDHTLRFPDGPTADHNLTCLCRHCHTRKHEAGWTLALQPNGDVIWTTPTGHTYTDPAPPVLDTGQPANETSPGTVPRPRTPAEDIPPF